MSSPAITTTAGSSKSFLRPLSPPLAAETERRKSGASSTTSSNGSKGRLPNLASVVSIVQQQQQLQQQQQSLSPSSQHQSATGSPTQAFGPAVAEVNAPNVRETLQTRHSLPAIETISMPVVRRTTSLVDPGMMHHVPRSPRLERHDEVSSSKASSESAESWGDDEELVNTSKVTVEHVAKFHKLFSNNVPPTEELFTIKSCAIEKEVLLHGRMYVSKNFICWQSHLLHKTRFVIPFLDVIRIDKRKFGLISNALRISTGTQKYNFYSIVNRDELYELLNTLWRRAAPANAADEDTLDDESEHSSGGDKKKASERSAPGSIPGLGQSPPIHRFSASAAVSSLNQKREAIAAAVGAAFSKEPRETLSATGTLERGATADKLSPQLSGRRSSFSGPVVEAGSLPLPEGDNQVVSDDEAFRSDDAKPRPRRTSLVRRVNEFVDKSRPGKETKTKKKLSGELSLDTTRDEKTQQTPVTSAAEMETPKTPKNQNTAAASPDQPEFQVKLEGVDYLNIVFPIPASVLFQVLFGDDSEFFPRFHSVRKSQDLQISPWQPDENGMNRNITYVIPVKIPFSSKTTAINNEIQKLRKEPDGSCYIIEAISQNPDVPYGTYFNSVTRYAITSPSATTSRLQGSNSVVFHKSTIVKAKIESTTAENVKIFFQVLKDELQKELDMPKYAQYRDSAKLPEVSQTVAQSSTQTTTAISSQSIPTKEAEPTPSQMQLFGVDVSTLTIMFLLFVLVLLIMYMVFSGSTSTTPVPVMSASDWALYVSQSRRNNEAATQQLAQEFQMLSLSAIRTTMESLEESVRGLQAQLASLQSVVNQ